MSNFALNAMNRSLSESPVSLDISRSTFPRSCRHLTTGNTGDLIPIYCEPVMAGDTYQMDLSEVVRGSSALKHPVMDDCVLDTYFFFVPHRLTWEHTAEFYGENKESYWTKEIERFVPQVKPPTNGWQVGDVAEKFGLPLGPLAVEGVDARPFRAYALIYNEWFRSENVQNPAACPLNDDDVLGVSGGDPFTNAYRGGSMFKVGKRFDYFTAALPSPQKGDASTVTQLLKVVPQSTQFSIAGLPPMTFANVNVSGDSGYLPLAIDHNDGDKLVNATTKDESGHFSSLDFHPVPNNLYASGAIDVNDLRFAFQLQKALEKDAMGGTRFREMLKAHFGTTIPDATVQIPEYLGGQHVRILNHQVTSTSQSATNPVGDPAAYSLTGKNSHVFTKSFCEPGYVIGVACIRVANRTYQQGVEKFWTRKSRWDEYYPVFANLGNQPIYTTEIYAKKGTSTADIFGYGEAWADYRYKPSHVTGQFRSDATGTLDSWHYADYFSAVPSLSSGFLVEPVEPVDRTRTVTSSNADQWLFDFYFDVKATRPMPVYSIPGLIDHH